MKDFFKLIGKGFAEKISPLANKLTSLFRKIAFGVLVVIVVVAIVVGMILMLALPDSLEGRVGKRMAFALIGLVTMTLGIAGAYAAASALRAGQVVSNAAKGASIVGAVIGALITWGVFFYSWGASDASAGSLAVNNMAADAMAATATLVLFAALACTGVGAIIVGIIAAIDGLITAICYCRRRL